MSVLQLDHEGWLRGARWIPSPNCDERPVGCVAELLVIHAISLPPEEFGGPGVEALFTNTLDASSHPYYAKIHHLRVSAHFFIRRDGELLQFVSTRQRAWHAGVSYWEGRERCNDFSLGIELEGSDTQAFEAAQYAQLNRLVACLAGNHPLQAICGHSDIAPGRKTDPGPFFDWNQLSSSVLHSGLRMR
ncbi:1,6-anhydro-N-acetylmuramyl-L-alanine amidase AmpD [Uliginosibacterium sp. 31-12]|uniref:1,6-anhydro-N-acetylmuramyl-L-alanine amidase AmpD n=1 Tax=Uliginosibacterium sp. 31-12 TaxID=3062781 RepID=UPI0026E32525|nr:1,6-anhydro-N-acetylmuramyl-L-alanine amidase AmpD [Uliginosibacterium sp. 31-12]MDO6384726.1 1,6-anhydro-N-acetylmuramyl-L-alanine amidase AmpD [Uliginosibacterium sp. 31-12]